MRIDKYLKVSRVIKRRTLAKEACECGRVSINGKFVKAGSEVKPGDVVEVNFGRRRLKIIVEQVRDVVPAKLAGGLYKVIEEEIVKMPEV